MKKNVIIGITGGIAAYKIPSLIRLFKKSGHEVRCVVTKNAYEFVTRTVLETLSENKVYDAVFSDTNDYTTQHVSLTDWGDVFIVCPATANIIGKYANGIADDALSTSLAAFDGPVLIAPAMNVKMYNNFAVQRNMDYLKSQDVYFLDAPFGDLACGYQGKGRMAEPEDIYKETQFLMYKDESQPLKGKKIVVTASRTEERLDPVRYFTNKSSGKMGFRLAEALSCLGADVTLITGPTKEKTFSFINKIDVISAEDMFNAVKENNNADCIIMSAAVADFTFDYNEKKLKKGISESAFKPKRTTDILSYLGENKGNKLLVGFALETDNVLNYAKDKLSRKNLDLIIANQTSIDKTPFGSDNNTIFIIDRDLKVEKHEDEDKFTLGLTISKKITSLLK